MLTREEFTTQIIQRSQNDDKFRGQLIEKPKETIESVLKTSLPDGIKVFVHLESGDTLHIVLPAENTEHLSDAEMEAVSGGTCWDNEPPANSCPMYDAT